MTGQIIQTITASTVPIQSGIPTDYVIIALVAFVCGFILATWTIGGAIKKVRLIIPNNYR